MNYHSTICILTCSILLATFPWVTTAQDSTGNDSFASMLREYWEDYLELHPVQATFAGDHRFNDRLPNPLSIEHRNQLKRFYQRYQSSAKSFNRNSLSGEERLSLDLLNWECDVHLKQLSFPTQRLPINQFESFHLTIGQLASGSSAQPFDTVKDYENWLQRLEQFHAWCQSALEEMKTGIRLGYVLPKALVKKLIPQFAALAKGPATKHLFYEPFRQFPETISKQAQEKLARSYEHLLDETLIPTFETLSTFLADEYLPAGRTTSGISAIPNGRGYYRHQIKIYTTTDLTPDEIFKIGEEEVDRLSSEMEKIKSQLQFSGSLKEFFDHVRSVPKLTPFKDPQQVIDNFNFIHQTMKPYVARLFRLTPKTAFEVRRTEAFREASSSAEYQPGSLDGTRPGIFYVPIPKVEDYNIFSDEDLFLHEAIPGHHYQISLQQENASLPQFRRPLWYSSYGEGWALYCESLGKELGLYKDPYQYFGMLSAEMHRAIRLVVDVGIHDRDWSREKAIQYSLDHEAEPEASIISEIERYMAWPGQALSYKIGQRKIIELRNNAEQRLGKAFDIRTFHDKVLESGCLPLTVLEKKIAAWINESGKKRVD